VGITRVDAKGTVETQDSALIDLVVVAEFRDPIYPGLVSTGTVERGGDKPYHSVINGENFHALQTLLFTQRGKVDAVYIDPPYNTGARDWKYNNDYVESEDLYRHSKWLAFMERRLLLAKELLNPDDSVLIVTIDEKEYVRLGILLEQLFPEAKRQMITSVISRNGTSRDDEFSRVDEYLFVLRFGQQGIVRTSDNMLAEEGGSAVSRIWFSFMRTSTPREQLEGQFYPVVVNTAERRVVRIEEPVGKGNPQIDPELGENEVAVWPVRQDGGTATWGAIVPTARELLSGGYLRVGGYDERTGRWSLHFVREGDRKRVSEGVIEVVGTKADGSKELEYADISRRESYPKTVWNRVSHDATSHGTRVLKELIPGRRFPYPKALYAVEDSLRFFLSNKFDATIVDFFSGSGTTAHAVFRLNKQDGGRRVSISVTNNEVSANEQEDLREQGLRPGDPDWERLGICEYITKPRIQAAITGKTPNGEPIKGDYKFTDVFPMADGFEENVEFFTLTYEAPLRVASHRDFPKVAPLLWLRAGSSGRRVDWLDAGWDVADTYGVIADLDKTDEFVSAVAGAPDVRVAFVITDEDRLFEAVVRDLRENVEPVRMYDAYLRNFELESRVPW
jgi:adenine-specific DNA-methyltransferase